MLVKIAPMRYTVGGGTVVRKQTCRECEREFSPAPDKLGPIDVCPRCETEDVPLTMAKVSWEGKHTPIIELTDDRLAAKYFNGAQKRLGASVVRAFSAASGAETQAKIERHKLAWKEREEREAEESPKRTRDFVDGKVTGFDLAGNKP